eukprot:580696-Alexandrium_andersonii.AAC.1
MLLRAVSILPESAPSSFEHFRAVSGAFGQFRALSGGFGLRPKPPETARKCSKLLGALSGNIETARSSIGH